MSVLSIKDGSGQSETRTLSKDEPLSIGRHASNDIQVDEDGVATLHCRLSWSNGTYQIASANSTGVIVNNQLTFRSDLKQGDVIRVGSLELTYLDDAKSAPRRDDEIGLQESEYQNKHSPIGHSPTRTASKDDATRPEEPDPKNRPLTAELVVEPVPPPLPIKKKKKEVSDPLADSLDAILSEVAERQEASSGNSKKQKLEEPFPLFSKGPVRPGERDLSRSPLMLFLGAGSLALILISLTLWFLIGRETAAQSFDRGMQEFQQKRFSLSIERFQEFLDQYPRHDLASKGRTYLAIARIEQHLAATTPNWAKAIELLEAFSRTIRQLKNFQEMQQLTRDLAQRIGIGAAEAAGAQKNRDLLEVSRKGSQILEVNSQVENRPVEQLKQIEDAQLKSERIIRRSDVTTSMLQDIRDQLSRENPLLALQEYRKLVEQYPDCRQEAEVAEQFREILSKGKSLVVSEDLQQPALTEEVPETFPRLILVKSTRARADLVESGANVFAIIGGSCMGIDSGTGMIRWQQRVGAHLPFSPVRVTSELQCLLLYNQGTHELQLFRQKDGGLVWRLSLPEGVRGEPLVQGGQILLVGSPTTLLQIDLSTGQLMKRVTFPQPVVGSPLLLSHDEQIVLAGEEQFTYILDGHSLECVGVVNTHQPIHSLQSPLLKMGGYVLFPMIDRAESSRLSVWDFSRGIPEQEAGSARIPGHVRDHAVLRGKQLFVPSSGERVTTFTVSDQAGSPLLTRTAGYQVPNGANGAIFLKPGPEDELWMSSSILQRLELSIDSIVPTGGQVALGSTTQPLQLVDQDLVVVGHPKGSRSFVTIAADRRQMVGRWQLMFGGHFLTVRMNEGGSVSVLSDAGDLFEFDQKSFSTTSPSEVRPVASLPDQTGSYSGLEAVEIPKRGWFVTAALPKPHWWLMSLTGQIINEGDLEQVLQASALAFEGGVVLPLKGKLSYLNPADPTVRIEDYILPQGDGPGDEWVSLNLDEENHLVASTKSGRLSRFQVRTEPNPHLFELSKADRAAETRFPPRCSSGKIYLASGKILECWNVGTWEREWIANLEETVSASPAVVGGQVLVESGGSHLSAFHPDEGKPLWQTELDSPLAGEPFLWNKDVTIPLKSGTLLRVVEQQGSQQIQVGDCGRTLGNAHVVLGESLILAGDDGCWFQLTEFPGRTR